MIPEDYTISHGKWQGSPDCRERQQKQQQQLGEQDTEYRGHRNSSWVIITQIAERGHENSSWVITTQTAERDPRNSSWVITTQTAERDPRNRGWVITTQTAKRYVIQYVLIAMSQLKLHNE